MLAMHQARTSCTLNYPAQRVWAAIGDLRGAQPVGTSGDRCEDGSLEFEGVVACSADQKSVIIDMLDWTSPGLVDTAVKGLGDTLLGLRPVSAEQPRGYQGCC